jgi:putrescine---pyruvate transaminase
MPTAELQALDAAHHMHPFTAELQALGGALGEKGRAGHDARQGRVADRQRGHEIIDGMAGLWCVNIGYGRDRTGRGRRAPDGRTELLQHLLPDHHVPAIALPPRSPNWRRAI